MFSFLAGSSSVLAILVLAGLVVFGQPLYVLVGAIVLRVIGVPKADVVAWALAQSGRNRAIDVVRAVFRPRDEKPP